MISGRANCSDDWLPARTRPVRGESFDSFCSPARRSEHRAPGTVFLGEKGQVSVAVDTHFCRLRSAHAERRRHRDNTYHANTANTLAQRSGSRDLAVLRPVRPGACIGLGTDRTMSITALRCEGSRITGASVTGLVWPRTDTDRSWLGCASIPQGRSLAECWAAVTGTELIEWRRRR